MDPRICIVAALLAAGACGPRRVTPAPAVRPVEAVHAAPTSTLAPEVALQVENLRAFARVYGYVRYFHPSDEASAVDWSALAVLGAGVVRDASDERALQDALTRLFAAVAPTLQIYREGAPAPELSRLTPTSRDGLTTVAWQHLGLGGGLIQSAYVSKRTDRTIELELPGAGIASIGPEPLFPATVAVGEVIDAPIGRGLRVQVPLALYSRDGRTLGGDAAAFAGMQALLASDRERRPLAHRSLEHPDLRAAAVVVAWNILQHFYPYFDVVAVDWAAALDEALVASVQANDGEVFRAALERMIAALADGHANVLTEGTRGTTGGLPLTFEWIEDAAVVVASATPLVRRGDVLAAVDGVPTLQRIGDVERRISGSPQWRRVRAMGRLAQGPRGQEARLTLRRGDAEVTATLAYAGEATPTEPLGPQIRREPDGVFYVDLERASWSEIEAVLPQLARAPGVVFDLRGYPNRNDEILAHLLKQPDTSRAWMQVPQIVRPDHVAPVAYQEHGWLRSPASPRISGKVAFLSGPGAISYAESVMGLVSHYRLGEIVGAATAGANGNINQFALPGGLRMVFTGMKVVRHDGSQHHIRGVEPTIPASRTIAGVRDGRDEVLERGLAVVRG